MTPQTPLPLSEAFGVKPTDGGLSDDAISLPDTAEREGRLWIRHAEKTASPYLRFDQWAVTMIPLPAGKRRWTMGPICLGGGKPWGGAVTHRPSTQCARSQPIACLEIIMPVSSPLLPGSFRW